VKKMKRFLADVLLIWMLVSLASYITNASPKQELDEKITEFEDEVARHEPIRQKVETSHLNNIEENTASKMAEAGSDFIIDVMHTGMDLVSQFFHGFMQSM